MLSKKQREFSLTKIEQAPQTLGYGNSVVPQTQFKAAKKIHHHLKQGLSNSNNLGKILP